MTARIAGLYAVTPDMADTDMLCAKVEAALAGGARVLQYRNKTAAMALKREQASRLHTLCRARGVPLVVNDDIDLALEIEAEGVHLGKDDGALRGVRDRVGDAMLLGASCYDSLERAENVIDAGADYVAFGSAFPSRVKPDAVRASIDLYREARALVRVPIVAIGGITLDNASSLLSVGVDALAVISAVFDASDVRQAAASFSGLFQKPV